jgi:hypothetical protein
MEYKAAFVVFLVELIAGILVFVFWRRRKSELNLAKEEFARFLQAHLAQGTLAQQLEDIAAGRLSVYQRRKSLKIYLWMGIAMVLGVALIYVVARFTGVGVWIRAIVGILSILPFIYFVSSAIAEEFDDNRISSFEKNSGRELLLKSQNESIESDINEMLKQ